MNNWTAEQIRTLRLRLGWSAADFSRRFGGDLNTILEWERGAAKPSPQHLITLEQLTFYLETYSEQVAKSPEAEKVLREKGCEQIHISEIQLPAT